MKAWSVFRCDYEYGVIVFADTRGRAKTLGQQSEYGLCDEDFISLQCLRMPDLDNIFLKEHVVKWDDSDEVRIYWASGWYTDIDMNSCNCCNRYEYDLIPESHLHEPERICEKCKQEREHLTATS